MVQNKHGGRRCKKQASKNATNITRVILFREHDQFYGKITKILGNCRFEITDSSRKILLGIARGRRYEKKDLDSIN